MFIVTYGTAAGSVTITTKTYFVLNGYFGQL